MTRKDYVLLAAALQQAQRPEIAAYAAQHNRDCAAVADALARENARFDRDRFLRACGLMVQS